jgi:phospholipid/cholesterol/gamma-HCH transport system permease protein
MTVFGHIGARTIAFWRREFAVVATAATVVALLPDPRSWPRSVRSVWARQVLFTAVEAVPFVVMIALAVAVAVVVQAQVWLGRAGQSGLVGPVVVFFMVREVGPLLTNFIVIGRSGSAMTAEMASMKVAGEVRCLDAQGLDPFLYLLLPRATAMAVSVLCLAILFVVVTLGAGFLFGMLGGGGETDPRIYLERMLGVLQPVDVLNLLAKTLVPGLLTGTICVTEGLSAGESVTEVPQAAARGVIQSVTALFLASALVSVLTYR